MAAWRPARDKILWSLMLWIGLLTPWLASAREREPGLDRYSSIVIEAATGRVLSAKDADTPRRPASLAKLMTLYMTFEGLRDHRLSLDEQVPFSAHAASMQPVKLGVPPGGSITVQDAILAMVTLSANDAASAMGELLAGSEGRFAQLMTLRARALGMTQTAFANASGLPADGEWTTARDMALLARHLIADFPDEYHYFSTPSFDFHGRIILNHDTELRAYPGADGMKTGYTIASGHNLVTSAVRDGVRLIGVELGAPSNGVRDQRMTAILNTGYESMGIDVGRPVMVASRGPAFVASAHAAEARPLVRTVVHISRPEPEHALYLIQVGSFRSKWAAEAAARKAHAAAEAGDVRLIRAWIRRHETWRAEIVGLTNDAAHDACSALAHRRKPCVVLHSAAIEEVSRG